MQEAMDEVKMGQVVEGVYSTKVAVRLGKEYEEFLQKSSEKGQWSLRRKGSREATNELMLRDSK